MSQNRVLAAALATVLQTVKQEARKTLDNLTDPGEEVYQAYACLSNLWDLLSSPDACHLLRQPTEKIFQKNSRGV